MIDQTQFENIKRLHQEYKDAVIAERRLRKQMEDVKASVENSERLWFESKAVVSQKLVALHDAAENISPE